ncbi:MAG: PAS domain S-box protein [Actinobacteria bacterium]|nr:PAS domain S-box protein [Micrococcales bacterium]MCB9428826.1 PAS domain S-box protein [Actinomycetota bacterium]MCO5298933.1 PAS domain S-box protein [Candidatus Nanopelagicales bacterium]HPE10979.1 PAS domain S-box protein [Actinomycetota bacterium]HRV64782.1 PAS domain S-box protein [Candidatus Nanopelagicales bacterium]
MSAFAECPSVLLDVTFVLQLQPSMRLEHISDSVIDFTGYSAAEYAAKPRLWLGAVDPRDRQLMLSAFNAAQTELTTMNLRFRTRDGDSIWAHQISRTVRTPDGMVLLYGSLTRIPAPTTLANVDDRYQMLAEDADDVVLQTDLAGRVVWVSDSITSVGWTPAELLGTQVSRMVWPDDRRVVHDIHRRVVQGQTVSGVIVRIRTADSAVRFISTTARPARNAQDAIVGSIVGWHDVDEVAQAHSAAEAERQLLRATLDAQLDPQVLVEIIRDSAGAMMDCRFIEANPAACDFIGVPRDELVGQTLQSVRPGLLGEIDYERLAARIASRRPLVFNDYLLDSLAGVRGRFDLRAVPVGDRLAVTWRDVTDRYEVARALAQSEARHRVLLEEGSDIVTFHDLDGGLRWISPAIQRLLGWQANDSALGQIMHPDDVEVMKTAREELEAGAESVSRRLRLRHRDGHYRWMQATARAVRDERGNVLSFVVVTRDIEDQVTAEQALETSESRYRLLAEHATDVVYQVSAEGITEWISDGVTAILGFTPDDLVGRSGLEMVVPEDRDYVDAVAREAWGGRRSNARFRLLTKDGGSRWVEATMHVVRGDAQEPLGFVGGWRDVQAEVEAQEALDLRARTDDLTGLLNRREALAQLVHSLAMGNGHRDQLAVAFCDVDAFKSINDSLGHSVGDRLLRTVADRIRGCVRSADTVARVGGDEILLILRGVRTLDDAMAIAEKVRLAVRAPIEMEGQLVPTSVSVGVTMATEDDDVDALVARADRAMYLAKAAGRDQVVRVL